MERLLINMRETRLFLTEEGYLTKELRHRLMRTPLVIIDLDKIVSDEDYDKEGEIYKTTNDKF